MLDSPAWLGVGAELAPVRVNQSVATITMWQEEAALGFGWAHLLMADRWVAINVE
jgi:hypothetical protein